MIKKLLLLGLMLLLQSCTQLLFQPLRPQLMTPDALGVLYDDVYIETDGKPTLHGWHLYAEGEVRGKVIFFHGNGENISTHVISVAWLTRHGYDVITVDYRGYGWSQGFPGLEGSIDDIDAAIRYTIAELLAKDEQLFVLGHSFGGSLSIAALAENDYQGRVKALFSISAFSDYRDITQDVLSTFWLTWPLQWPLSFTVNNDYSPKQLVAKISPLSIVIIHAKDDQIVPVYHADILYSQAKQPKYIDITSGGHNRILLEPENQLLLLDYLNRFSSE
ncbi:MAG: lysophospholipase [Gammaproteobacteria bacterium]|nr:lysophospholipase [Gammaproteobacteria bacterium]